MVRKKMTSDGRSTIMKITSDVCGTAFHAINKYKPKQNNKSVPMGDQLS